MIIDDPRPSWTICPECGMGKGYDHKPICSLREPKPPTIYGRGTPCDAIAPGKPEDGEPWVVAQRNRIARAVECYEVNKEFDEQQAREEAARFSGSIELRRATPPQPAGS